MKENVKGFTFENATLQQLVTIIRFESCSPLLKRQAFLDLVCRAGR